MNKHQILDQHHENVLFIFLNRFGLANYRNADSNLVSAKNPGQTKIVVDYHVSQKNYCPNRLELNLGGAETKEVIRKCNILKMQKK